MADPLRGLGEPVLGCGLGVGPLGVVALHHLLGFSFLFIILSNYGTTLSHQSRVIEALLLGLAPKISSQFFRSERTLSAGLIHFYWISGLGLWD